MPRTTADGVSVDNRMGRTATSDRRAASAPVRVSAPQANREAQRLRETLETAPQTTWHLPAPPSKLEELAFSKVKNLNCATDQDCPTGSSCGWNFKDPGLRCVTANCRTNSDCQDGEECQAASLGESGPAIRRCAAPGPRQNGEFCKFAGAQEKRCGPGLVCLSNRCVRSCASGCQDGEQCFTPPEGALIPPVCGRGCSSDQECVDANTGDVCVTTMLVPGCRWNVSAVEDCTNPEHACEPGFECHVAHGDSEVMFRCLKSCNPLDASSCGEGEVCGVTDGPKRSNGCFKKCIVDKQCKKTESCQPVDQELKLLGCQPDAE